MHRMLAHSGHPTHGSRPPGGPLRTGRRPWFLRLSLSLCPLLSSSGWDGISFPGLYNTKRPSLPRLSDLPFDIKEPLALIRWTTTTIKNSSAPVPLTAPPCDYVATPACCCPSLTKLPKLPTSYIPVLRAYVPTHRWLGFRIFHSIILIST
jgi:hypothetical protein